MSCVACASPIDLSSREPAFPAAWRVVTEGLAPWIPKDRSRAHVRLCDECGTYWHLLYDMRDETFSGGRAFLPEAAVVLRAESSVASIVAAGVAHPGARPLVGLWLAHAALSGSDLVAALARSLAASDDAATTDELLHWLLAARKRADAIAAIATDAALHALLEALQRRAWPSPTRPASAVAAEVARILGR